MKSLIPTLLALGSSITQALADPIPHEPHAEWQNWQGHRPESDGNLKGYDADYVIVGGGIAGLVIAEQLSQDPNIRVVVLEAGPDGTNNHGINTPALAATIDMNTQWVWNFTSQPDPNLDGGTPAMVQGHAWGGSSAVNYQAYSRGAASVFDEWATISGDDGPKFDNLLNDFRATSNFVNDSISQNPHIDTSVYGNGPLDVTSSDDDLGFNIRWNTAIHETLNLPFVDTNAGYGIGISSAPATIRSSNRTRDYALPAFGWQMAHRANVQLIDHAWVSKIGFAGNRATNVTYTSSIHDTVHTISPREIVLTAGAINSPKLLMLSGIGPADQLEEFGISVVSDIPEMGSNLYNHHFSVLEYEINSEAQTMWQYTNNASFSAIADASYAQNGSGFLGVPGGDYALQRVPDEVFEAVNYTFHTSLPADRGQLLYQWVAAPFLSGANVSVISPFVALVQPEASGYMRLNSSDYRDDPLIYSNYYGSAGDKAPILYGYKTLRRVLHSSSTSDRIVREVFPGEAATSDEELWKAIQKSATSFYHPLGTVALGKVVDAGRSWRIRGLEGIRVADSSTFPTPPNVHLQAIVYAYAHHVAGVIRAADQGWCGQW